MGRLSISQVGLPQQITENYSANGIHEIYDWQAECLTKFTESKQNNLVISAPTSSGKTLVSEILMFQSLHSTHQKALIVLPFVSLADELVKHIEKICKQSKFKVGGFFGNVSPIGGLQAVDVAICTIEKANNIINRLQQDEELDKICFVLIDEVHMISDSSRGYLLEVLLTKLLYVQTCFNISVKIVAMSATMSEGPILAEWLRAEYFATNYRPLPLAEFVSCGSKIYDGKTVIRELSGLYFAEYGNILELVVESLLGDESVVVFCQSKASCEALAVKISDCLDRTEGRYSEQQIEILENIAGKNTCKELIVELTDAAGVVDEQLKRGLRHCVAFHHAGMTLDERASIEEWVRLRKVRVVVATTTLSSGVNLPFQRVVIAYNSIRTLTPEIYHQMSGRGGRTPSKSEAHSYLISSENELIDSFHLITRGFTQLKSTLYGSKFRRAIFEAIACSKNPIDVNLYINCTLFVHLQSISQEELAENIKTALDDLFRLNFVDKTGTEDCVKATQQGYAAFQAGFDLVEARNVLEDIEKTVRSLNLEDDLHLIYLVTPSSISDDLSFPWNRFYDIWATLPHSAHSVAQSIGISEHLIIRGVMGRMGSSECPRHFKRFYCSLALHELVREIPLATVSSKFGIIRGTLQSLQRSCAVFAAMVTTFCECIGRTNLALLLQQLRICLHFGVERELTGLMRLPSLKVNEARALYRSGFATVAQIAMGDPIKIRRILVGENIGDSKIDVRQKAADLMAFARDILKDDLLGFTFEDGHEDKMGDICDSFMSMSLFGDSNNDKMNSLDNEFSNSFEHDCLPQDVHYIHICSEYSLPFKLELAMAKQISIFPIFEVSLVGFVICFGARTLVFHNKDWSHCGLDSVNSLVQYFPITATWCVFDYRNVRLPCFKGRLNCPLPIFDPLIYHTVISRYEKLPSLDDLSALYMSDQQRDGISRGVTISKSTVKEAVISAKTVLKLGHIMLNLDAFKNHGSTIERELRFCCVALPTVESVGIEVSQNRLLSVIRECAASLESVYARIYKLAGRKVKLESPTDISKLLYTQLKLPPTSTPSIHSGDWNTQWIPFLSTDKLTLEPLKPLHPIVGLIIQWRKVHSAYQLMKCVERHSITSKVFTKYDTFTASGRFYTTSPNLQCIAKQFSLDDSLEISPRESFIAGNDHILLSADYSQLELRIIAHLSKDVNLCSILLEGGDVFRRIAAHWANIEEPSVNNELRQRTKMLCYGIIYGMGASSLANLIKESPETSQNMIDSFLRDFSGLDSYIKDTIEECRSSNGRARTLFGTFRHFPDVLCSDYQLRTKAQRQAVNFTVQGTAADLMKMCLLKMTSQFMNMYSRQLVILVIHDEFLLQVPRDQVDRVSSTVRQTMEEIVELSVPLCVKITTGEDWASLK